MIVKMQRNCSVPKVGIFRSWETVNVSENMWNQLIREGKAVSVENQKVQGPSIEHNATNTEEEEKSYEDMTVKELKQIAEENWVEISNKDRKVDLIEKIKDL